MDSRTCPEDRGWTPRLEIWRSFRQRVWTANTGEEVCTLPLQDSGVSCIVVSPDGYQIASGTSVGSIALRDSMSRIRRYEQRADSQLIDGEAKRAIDAYAWAGLDEAEMARRILADDSLSEPLRRAALNRILQMSLSEKGES